MERQEYFRQALEGVTAGDDQTSYFFRVMSETHQDRRYKVRIYPLQPDIGSSEITCECPHAIYRCAFCKHKRVAYWACIGGDEMPEWKLPFLISDDLRAFNLKEQVRMHHLTDWSIVLSLPPQGTPFGAPLCITWPQWRVFTLLDWRQVLPKIIKHLFTQREAQDDVA